MPFRVDMSGLGVPPPPLPGQRLPLPPSLAKRRGKSGPFRPEEEALEGRPGGVPLPGRPNPTGPFIPLPGPVDGERVSVPTMPGLPVPVTSTPMPAPVDPMPAAPVAPAPAPTPASTPTPTPTPVPATSRVVSPSLRAPAPAPAPTPAPAVERRASTPTSPSSGIQRGGGVVSPATSSSSPSPIPAPPQDRSTPFESPGFWGGQGTVDLPGGARAINRGALSQEEYDVLSGLRAGRGPAGPFAQRILEGLVARGVVELPGAPNALMQLPGASNSAGISLATQPRDMTRGTTTSAPSIESRTASVSTPSPSGGVARATQPRYTTPGTAAPAPSIQARVPAPAPAPASGSGDPYTTQRFVPPAGWQVGAPIPTQLGSITIPQGGLTQQQFDVLSGVRAGNLPGGPFAQRVLDDLIQQGVFQPQVQRYVP